MVKWVISTIFDATKFLSSPSEHYHETFSPPQALITYVVDSLAEFKDLLPHHSGTQFLLLMIPMDF